MKWTALLKYPLEEMERRSYGNIFESLYPVKIEKLDVLRFIQYIAWTLLWAYLSLIYKAKNWYLASINNSLASLESQ